MYSCISVVLEIAKLRTRVKGLVQEALACDSVSDDVKALYQEWLDNYEDGPKSRELSDKIQEAIADSDVPCNQKVKSLAKYLVKRSQWIVGGNDASWNTQYPNADDVVARFNVTGSDEPVGNLMEYTATPTEGNVTSLKDIVLEFPNSNSMDINDSTGVSVLYNGDQNVDVNPLKATGKKVTISLKNEQNQAGEYRVIIAAEAICAYSTDDYLFLK